MSSQTVQGSSLSQISVGSWESMHVKQEKKNLFDGRTMEDNPEGCQKKKKKNLYMFMVLLKDIKQ